MTITEEVIHELRRLRIKANKDVKVVESNQGTMASYDKLIATKAFKNGLSMAIQVANQINNRRSRKK